MTEEKVCVICGTKKHIHYSIKAPNVKRNEKPLCTLCAYKYAVGKGDKRSVLIKKLVRDSLFRHEDILVLIIDIILYSITAFALAYGLYKYSFVTFDLYGFILVSLVSYLSYKILIKE